MRTLLLTLIQLLFTLSTLFGQCGSCTSTVSMPNSGFYSVGTNETLCLTGTGTFSGTVNLNNNNSVLCISENVEFTGSLGFNSGELNNYGSINGLFLSVGGTLNNYGEMLLTGINMNNGSEFNNENTTFGAVEVTGTVSINNGADITLRGGMVVGGNLNVNSGGDLNLDGAGVTVGGTLSVNSANSINGQGNTSGCEGVTFGSLNLNNANGFSGNVDICDADDPSSTIVANNTSQCNCSSLLPVEFINYKTTANYEKEAVEVNWSTATELNSAYYIIERSANGYTFSALGTVTAAGNSDQLNTYFFLDETPILGTAYYRIKQVDLDGTFVYTNTMVQYYVNETTQSSMEVVLSGGDLQLNFSEFVDHGELEIRTYTGRLFIKEKIQVNAYSLNHKVNKLSTGVYIVCFRSKNKLWFRKMIIN